MPLSYVLLILLLFCSSVSFALEPKVVSFPNGNLTLRGELFLPAGDGPFPIVLYNHGSAPKMWNSEASAAIAPMFVSKGWGFFMPYRRGQGLSEDQGDYIMDKIQAARWWLFESSTNIMVELLKTDHFSDQMAALNWLKSQDFAQKERIAAMGNSFGGIQVALGMATNLYCAGVDAAGAAESWNDSVALQLLMKTSVKKSKNPIFFFQAENDYDISPSKELFSEMVGSIKKSKLKIYPSYGASHKEGHSFAYRGTSIWFNDVYSFLAENCPAQNPN
ncbi:MAG TPA: prolyl oligopeptidase family serine peptidase [Cellvibrionaceae bacterium]